MRGFFYRFIFLCVLTLFGRYACAQSNTDSLIQSLKKTQPDTQRIMTLGLIAWDYSYTDLEKAKTYAQKALDLSKKIKWKPGEASMYHMQGTIYEITGELDKASAANAKALALRKTLHDTLGMGKSYGNMGNVAYAQGNIPQALENYLQSTYMLEKAGEMRMLATTWVNIGVIYQNQADYPASLNYLLKALAVMERTGYTGGIGFAQSNLGVTYSYLGEYEKSAKAHLATLEIQRKTKDVIGSATTLTNLGNTYSHLNQNKKAKECLDEAYAIFEKAGLQDGMAGVMFDQALILDQEGNVDAAIEKQERCLALRLKDTGFVSPVAECYIHLAGLYLKKNNKTRALECAAKGLVYAKKSGNNNVLLEALRKKANALVQKGSAVEAVGLLNEYISLRDSLFSQERANQLTRKELEFDFEKDKLADSLVHVGEQKRHALELEKTNAQLGKERIIRYFLFAFAVLLLGGGYFIYRAYRNKQKDNELIRSQKLEVEMQKSLVDEKNKEILDSIHYAKKIQYTLLANKADMQKHMSRHFVLFQPKDVVSGDFYWTTSVADGELKKGMSADGKSIVDNNQHFYLAVCDSTGHGVPGAFMSLLNISFLNEAFNEKHLREPAHVFDHVRSKLIENISQGGSKDGMDGILVQFPVWYERVQPGQKLPVRYAAANNRPIIVRNNQVIELPYDKMPVGLGEINHPFTLYTTELESGDMLYLFTDGYADQFGGDKGKKFKYVNLQKLLLEISVRPVEEQARLLQEHFEKWRGGLEQVDDVMVIGIRV